MSDQSGETSTTSLAAEAASLHRTVACDGSDRHPLGWPPQARAGVLVAAVALVAVVSRVNALGGFRAVAWGVLLGGVLSAGMSTSVVGDQLWVNRFGWRRRIPLATVSRVEWYSYRSAVSLRLWDAGGDRLPSIPVSGLGYRISPAAAAHVLRCLDQPDVHWGLAAWETLREKAGNTLAGDYADAKPAPRGRLVPGKAPSGWLKAGLYASVAGALIAAVVVVVLVPVTWRGYLESQRIQRGPQVGATLERETITVTSGRSGTHHTTHFLVMFTTQSGEQVTTTVNAHGRYDELAPGSHFSIRYDPRSPRHAELPRAPMNSLTSALLVTAFAGFVIVSVSGVAVRRRRRRSAYPR